MILVNLGYIHMYAPFKNNKVEYTGMERTPKKNAKSKLHNNVYGYDSICVKPDTSHTLEYTWNTSRRI